MKRTILLLLIASLALACSSADSAGSATDSPTEPGGDAAGESAEKAPDKPEVASDDSMVQVPAGEYLIGSSERPEKQKDFPQWFEPEHKVKLDSFWIDAYEVTFFQFMNFAQQTEHKIEGDYQRYFSTQRAFHPVFNITHKDAAAYCEWAGKRLPTEFEWEAAARGPEGFRYPWGNEWELHKANTNEYGSHDTEEVGNFDGDRSAFGVYDMLGSLQEWTSGKMRAYPQSPARRDQTFRRGFRSVRGMSHSIKGREVALWYRFGFLDAQAGIGFRCAKDAEEEEGAASSGQ